MVSLESFHFHGFCVALFTLLLTRLDYLWDILGFNGHLSPNVDCMHYKNLHNSYHSVSSPCIIVLLCRLWFVWLAPPTSLFSRDQCLSRDEGNCNQSLGTKIDSYAFTRLLWFPPIVKTAAALCWNTSKSGKAVVRHTIHQRLQNQYLLGSRCLGGGLWSDNCILCIWWS